MQENSISIIGAGPAGAAAALILAKNNIPCTLIDKAQFPRDKICGDACSGKVAWVLKKYDAQLFETIIKDTSSLDSWGVKFYGSKNNELKVPFKLNYDSTNEIAPGFISKRIDFDNLLIEEVKKHPSIQFIENLSIHYYKRNGKHIEFGNNKENQHFKTNLLLAADGAYSLAAKSLMNQKIDDTNNSLGLRAYYKNVKKLDNEGFIELHFLEEALPGYFWIFPLANGEANVGLGIRSDIAKKKKINIKHLFEQILNNNPHIAPRFKEAQLINPIKLHGLPLQGQKKYTDNQLILLGDAAALIDPFTGEGIGNAMISGMTAAEIIINNYASKTFEAAHLLEYDQKINKRFKNEFTVSKAMQELSRYPWLFNFVVNKANKNKELKETISCMFENVDLRKKLSNPLFYLRILFS